jgi:cell shape-determining protein MreC
MNKSDPLAELAAANRRIKVLEAENQQLREAAARVVKHHDQGTMAAKSDSNCIEALRSQITGSSR